MSAWDRYTILVASCTNGPMRVEVEDQVCDTGGTRGAREVVVSVFVDLYCLRCDCEIAALEPDDVALLDVVSVIEAHELVCVPAPSWPGNEATDPKENP